MTDKRGIGMTSQRARDRLITQLRDMGIRSGRVLDLLRTTPRHLFIDEAISSRAYENIPLPIGHGQTISQPYIVARMTEALLESGSMTKVLEVGAGCGYQTAILAQLANRVFAIERIDTLTLKLRERLLALRYSNVRVRHGDGMQGWPTHAPFDAILVAAAPYAIPPALTDQLAIGGRMVIPVGGSSGGQRLMLVTRNARGLIEQELEKVSFVPLLEGYT